MQLSDASTVWRTWSLGTQNLTRSGVEHCDQATQGSMYMWICHVTYAIDLIVLIAFEGREACVK
jgi:hypothetical protein